METMTFRRNPLRVQTPRHFTGRPLGQTALPGRQNPAGAFTDN